MRICYVHVCSSLYCICMHWWGSEDNLQELVPLLGGSQELNSSPWIWQQLPLSTQLSAWLLFCELELPLAPKYWYTDQHSHCGGTTLSSLTWGFFCIFSAWFCIYFFWVLTQKWSCYIMHGMAGLKVVLGARGYASIYLALLRPWVHFPALGK